MEKEIKLIQDYGNAKEGDIFIQGLHGVPDFPAYKDTKPENWYWKKGSEKKDNDFLMSRWIKEN